MAESKPSPIGGPANLETKTDQHNNATPDALLDELESKLDSQNIDLKMIVQEEMMEYPGLSTFVEKMMNEALIPAEEDLIAKTSLVVFQYFKRNQIKPEPLSVDDEIENVPISEVPTMIMISEDDNDYHTGDKNRIFISLQRNMKEHPKLSEFVAGMMRQSVSLEEANLIGRTALIVHDIVTFPFVATEDGMPHPS